MGKFIFPSPHDLFLNVICPDRLVLTICVKVYKYKVYSFLIDSDRRNVHYFVYIQITNTWRVSIREPRALHKMAATCEGRMVSLYRRLEEKREMFKPKPICFLNIAPASVTRSAKMQGTIRKTESILSTSESTMASLTTRILSARAALKHSVKVDS